MNLVTTSYTENTGAFPAPMFRLSRQTGPESIRDWPDSTTFEVKFSNMPTQIEKPPEPVIVLLQGKADQNSPLTNESTGSRQAGFEHRLENLVSHHHLLTNKVKSLITGFWAIVLSKALQSGLRVTGAVDVEEDSEEASSQVVLRVYVQASAAQTLAFWDGLDRELGHWLGHLDESNRRIVINNIGLRMHWLGK